MRPLHLLTLVAITGCFPGEHRAVIRYYHVRPAAVVAAEKTGQVPPSTVGENMRDVLVAIVTGAANVAQPLTIAIPVAGQLGAGIVERAGEAEWDVHRLDVPTNGATSITARLEFEADRLKSIVIESQRQRNPR
jgi:hypothetical protein